jgi:SAM-dependent methyltransferase
MRSDAASAQRWSADSYDQHARFVSDLAGEVMGWLAPVAGERILDLGCGDGALTEKLQELGCTVVGVDSGEDMVRAAKARGVDARIMDGHALSFASEFDAVFSNAALHWMSAPRLVVQGVARALKPKGRFVAEFGGHGNVAAIVTALRAVGKARGGSPDLAAPWFYPTPAEYRELLEAERFTVERIGLYPRPTPLRTGMRAWLKVFRKPFFDQFGPEADAAVAEVEELLRPALCDTHENWTADYVRLRVEAVKP